VTGVVVNSGEFFNGLKAFEERFERLFRDKVRRLVSEGLRRLITKTPVNTGQAVMNYVATGGNPYSGGVKEAGAPVEATNRLPLGAERLRPAAAGTAMATLATVDFSDPYNVFFITNKTPHIQGLEYGLLPAAPYTPRSPSGMFGVTVQELMQLLSSGRV